LALSDDGTLSLLESWSGRTIRCFRGGADLFHPGFGVSSDGRLAASEGPRHSVIVWRVPPPAKRLETEENRPLSPPATRVRSPGSAAITDPGGEPVHRSGVTGQSDTQLPVTGKPLPGDTVFYSLRGDRDYVRSENPVSETRTLRIETPRDRSGVSQIWFLIDNQRYAKPLEFHGGRFDAVDVP
jgi:hypothetical protein